MDLRETYRIEEQDFVFTATSLDQIYREPLLNFSPLIVVMYDSKEIHAFIPKIIQIKPEFSFQNMGRLRVVTVSRQNEEAIKTWRQIMNPNRGIPGATC